jgi:hypothetical protein
MFAVEPDRVQQRLAAVVNGPENTSLPLGTGEAARLVDLLVLEATGDLELQSSRLLRVGAAGNQQ